MREQENPENTGDRIRKSEKETSQSDRIRKRTEETEKQENRRNARLDRIRRQEERERQVRRQKQRLALGAAAVLLVLLTVAVRPWSRFASGAENAGSRKDAGMTAGGKNQTGAAGQVEAGALAGLGGGTAGNQPGADDDSGEAESRRMDDGSGEAESGWMDDSSGEAESGQTEEGDAASGSAVNLTEEQMLAAIYENRSSYPPKFIEDVELNPEITEFVYGYPEAEPVAAGGLTEEEKQDPHPLFMQWDSRWGYQPYGLYNIGISGCGPTCLSMVVFALTRDETATPDAVATFSKENGYYIPYQGTTWDLMTSGAASYGVQSAQISFVESDVKARLDQGQVMIASMGPGDFSAYGHFIMIWGYDEEGFRVNDSFRRSNSEKSWPYETLVPQLNGIWACWV